MPLIIREDLPAFHSLQKENVFIVNTDRAVHQDIRPLQIGILNLMPNKIETEIQLMRLLSNTPLQVQVELIQMKTHNTKNTSAEYLNEFYKTFDEIRDRHFDALLITGAPIENYDFERVDFWQELCEILDWERQHVFSSMHICWGAQAALYHFYDVPKYILPEKKFGVFPHRILSDSHNLLRGFDDVFYTPHSRHTEIREDDLKRVKDLEIMAVSEEAGPHIISDREGRKVFITGHFEYDADTLHKEFLRDQERGDHICMPQHYYKNDDPHRKPLQRWKAHANLFYYNWLNYVYQETPYDLRQLEQ